MIGADDELGKDIAMQVAAANPSYLTEPRFPRLKSTMKRKFLL